MDVTKCVVVIIAQYTYLSTIERKKERILRHQQQGAGRGGWGSGVEERLQFYLKTHSIYSLSHKYIYF